MRSVWWPTTNRQTKREKKNHRYVPRFMWRGDAERAIFDSMHAQHICIFCRKYIFFSVKYTYLLGFLFARPCWQKKRKKYSHHEILQRKTLHGNRPKFTLCWKLNDYYVIRTFLRLSIARNLRIEWQSVLLLPWRRWLERKAKKNIENYILSIECLPGNIPLHAICYPHSLTLLKPHLCAFRLYTGTQLDDKYF